MLGFEQLDNEPCACKMLLLLSNFALCVIIPLSCLAIVLKSEIKFHVPLLNMKGVI